MNGQRTQAYVRLIEQLLSCPQGQEMEVLQAKAELVDAKFLEVMEQYAAHLESHGNDNATGWLREFAAKLAQSLGLEQIASSALKDAAQFMLETLQLIYENKGNPQQIYPVWAQQQVRLNEELLKVLPIVVEQQFQVGDAEQQRFIAAWLVEFGNQIQHFPSGIRWLNLELSIAAYKQALVVFTKQARPLTWAIIMMNLATSYKERIQGDRSENIEQGIATYKHAITVLTMHENPAEWEANKMNLETGY